MRIVLTGAVWWVAVGVAVAQPPSGTGTGTGAEQLPPGHPPTGPVGVFGQIAEQRQAADQEGREQRGDAALPPDEIHRILSGESPELSTARPDESVPAGTIRVLVVDEAGQPVAGQAVELGIMGQNDQRTRRESPTDAEGRVVFSGLGTGQSQAYRVNVAYRGAKSSSTPFQLPPNVGYDVRVIRLPTTRDDRAILQLVHRTFLELTQDSRVRVAHQIQLVNLARETYVLPSDGKHVRLPAGFTAFQSQPVMTDQRIVPTDDGLTLHGSIPPGRVNLVWGYDLPLDGTSISIRVPVVFRTYVVRVEANAPEGMELDVAGLPDPQVHEVDGHRLLITEMQRSPEDPPLERVEIHLRGIPGPGPWRYLAVGAALVFLAGGVMFLFQRGRHDRGALAAARAQRKTELLDRAAEVERMFEENEIGPKFRQQQMDGIIGELALVLRTEDQSQR